MEFLFNWVLPLWIASWLMIIWQIFFPAIRIIREIDSDHVIWRWRYMTFLLFGIMAFVCVPIMLIPALVESYRRQFIYNYVRNLVEDESED
jgi:hypothetical protein